MAFSYSNGTITQTGTDVDLSGLSGLTGVTTTTTGSIITYSLANNILLTINGDCLIDPRINELETNRVSTPAISVVGTLTLGVEIVYAYGSQYTSGRALNIVGGSNVPWGGIFNITGTVNWYGCEVESASGINIYSGATLRIRDGVFISRLGNHTIQQGNAFIFAGGSTCDIIGVKKTLTGSLTHDNSAINILGAITTLNASGIDSTGGISPDNRSSTLATVPYSITSNFKRLKNPIAQCRTSLNYFIDCATWDTPAAIQLAYRSQFGTITRFGQAEFYRNCNGKIIVNGVGLQNAQLYWQDADNGGRGITQSTEWLQEYITDREYYATTDVNGEFTQQVLEAAFYNTNPNVGVGANPNVDDRTETGHKITFSGYKYGYGVFSIEFQGNRIVSASATTPVIIDGNITEANKTTVDSYGQINTSAKLYDRAASFLQDNLGSTYLDFILLKSGSLINAGSYNVNIDASAVSAFDISGNTITIKASTFTGDMTTTGIITLVNGATFIGVRTDANGTINPDLNISITNIVANSRIQIFNVSTGVEVVNQSLSGTSYVAAYPEGTGYSDGNTIRVRLTNADLSGYLGYETTVIAGSTGWSALANQQLDTVYNNINVDGSTVTKFSSDYVGNDIELSVASNFTIGSFYAYWVFNLTTADGIRNFFGSIIAVNDANIMVDTDILSLYFDSTVNQSVRQTDNRRLYRRDGLYPVRQPTTSGYGLDVTWQSEIFVVEMDVAVPSLTAAETANLAEITSVKTKTDQLEFTGTDLKATLDGEQVVTDTASRNASKADVSSLSTFNAATDAVANVTLVGTVTTNTDMRGTDSVVIPTNLSTFDPVNDTVANVTLVATTTTNTDMRGTDGANTIAPTTAPTVSEIRAGFVANDFKATTTISSNMRGTDNAITSVAGLSTFDATTDAVITNTASRNASKADVSGLSTFNPTTDAVANVTLVGTTTTNTDMRGTDGANTIAPVTPPTVVEIRAGFVADDFKATTTISSNMRGTDGAITSVSGLSTFDAATDTVANVTLVGTTTTNTDMRGTDGANTVTPVTPPTVTEIRAGFIANDFKATGFSTFDSSVDTVITDTASRNASKADVTGLSTFDPATDNIAELTTYAASALPKIRAILIDTDDLFTNQGDWVTATGFSTFDNTSDSVVTDTASRDASRADVSTISTQVDELHKLGGLSQGNAATFTPTSITVDDISLTITGDGNSSSTVTRDA